MVFSSENALVSFTLVYPLQTWRSIEVPFQQTVTSLKLPISRNTWTIWSENDKETITVNCKDFALLSTLSPVKNQQVSGPTQKRFLFSISDSSVVASFANKPSSSRNSQKIVPRARVESSPFFFPQSNSEFNVEFPEKPTIRTVQSELGPVEQADLVSDQYSVLRAEYGLATSEQLLVITNASEQQRTEIGMAVGKLVGYTGISVTSGKTNLGTYIKLRGYKIINGVSFLIEHLMYYGKRSIMTIVTGSRSTDYPTPKIHSFVNSLKKQFN